MKFKVCYYEKTGGGIFEVILIWALLAIVALVLSPVLFYFGLILEYIYAVLSILFNPDHEFLYHYRMTPMMAWYIYLVISGIICILIIFDDMASLKASIKQKSAYETFQESDRLSFDKFFKRANRKLKRKVNDGEITQDQKELVLKNKISEWMTKNGYNETDINNVLNDTHYSLRIKGFIE